MSKSKHRQSAFGWNPPPLPKDAPLPYDAPQSVVSATQCTGLAPRPLSSESECRETAALYAALPFKPEGNIGKGNPQNPPEEIGFHRK